MANDPLDDMPPFYRHIPSTPSPVPFWLMPKNPLSPHWWMVGHLKASMIHAQHYARQHPEKFSEGDDL